MRCQDQGPHNNAWRAAGKLCGGDINDMSRLRTTQSCLSGYCDVSAISANCYISLSSQGFVGTQAYMAPEVFTRNMHEGHGRAADIWWAIF